MQENENILRIFQKTKEAVSRGDSAEIKNLSNQTNNTAALTNDPDNIATAVIIYALSKIIEREDYKKLLGWNRFYGIYIKAIDRIIVALKKEDYSAFREDIKIIRGAIEKLSGTLKQSIQEVFRKASINKASKLYEHGISMEKTAGLLGITLFELASSAGQRDFADAPQMKTIDVKARIKLAEDFFR
jgi:hypothetical protein